MLRAILRFELRYWLSGAMVYIFCLLIAAMIFGATSSDQVVVGSSLQNTKRNAPWVVQNYYSIIAFLTMLMTTAFVNSAASRDFQYGTAGLVFSKPVRKGDYVWGRFFGSYLAALIPMLGVSLGVLFAPLAPWADGERFGPIFWNAHASALLTFALPNTLFSAAVIFTIAVLTRSTVASFLGSLALLVLYGVADSFADDLRNETLAAMLDPFGTRAFAILTKYWTVAEKNSLSVGWQGVLLWNRLLWLAVTGGILAFTYLRFSFSERAARIRKRQTEDPVPSRTAGAALAPFAPAVGGRAEFSKFLGLLRFEFQSLIRTTTFVVILAAALLNMVPTLIFNAREMFGATSLPVTYSMIELIQGTLYLFLVGMITFFAGVLVWRERDARMDELEDTQPRSDWSPYVAKLISLLFAVALIQLLAMLCAIAVQTYHGYHRYQVALYLNELLGEGLLTFAFLAVLAFLIHVLAPNKYVGYFAFVAFLIGNAFVWGPLNVATRLVRFASRPDRTYSDLFGFAPYESHWWAFTLYWTVFCVFLAALTVLMWPRGKQDSLQNRLRIAGLRWRSGRTRRWVPAVGLLFLAMLGWLTYDTAWRNRLMGPKTALNLQAEYERTYKWALELPQPRVASVHYTIDLYPERRAMTLVGNQIIVNRSQSSIDQVHLNMDNRFTYEDVAIQGAQLVKDDRRLSWQTYRLNPPMKPGESRRMTYTVRFAPAGIENSVTVPEIAQNGTFFNNSIVPQIGYQRERELNDINERRKRNLPERDRMPPLERNCDAKCRNTYISNNSDWTAVETVMSTSPDQIAVAPGSLLKDWTANGRRYFHYRLDHDSLNFYSFASARYEVVRDEINGVRGEVYYHHEHPWNVGKMREAIKASLNYYTSNFGPYFHKQARILEFPRIARFAQAFPGTMPYSEAIGFIADLEKPDAIDFVFYIVAHEIAHQWWAHQVVGADMQGATLLSETLAQYSALMVMERQYGPNTMQRFLEYEADRYLRGRGRERLKERPLLTVESSQGYIHYQKGSLAMYYLKEMIGEEAVNRALRKVIQKYAYAEPPYPTSHALLDALREETPAHLQYLLTDLFEQITLFSNRTVSAKARKLPNGKYEVVIDVESRKFKADTEGNETEIPLGDQVEIGAYAKVEKGKKYPRLIHRERVSVRAPRSTFTFIVSELPDKAGIDPRALLVDRIPADNLKAVDLL